MGAKCLLRGFLEITGCEVLKIYLQGHANFSLLFATFRFTAEKGAKPKTKKKATNERGNGKGPAQFSISKCNHKSLAVSPLFYICISPALALLIPNQ